MLVDFRKIDGWVSWEVLFGVLFRVMVRAHFCSIDGRVLLGAFFGVLLFELVFWMFFCWTLEKMGCFGVVLRSFV